MTLSAAVFKAQSFAHRKIALRVAKTEQSQTFEIVGEFVC
jgi:hypothetical protein